MTIRIVLEGRDKDVEECLSVGDTVWISDEKVDALLGGPLTVISCDEVTESRLAKYDMEALRDMAQGGLISEDHPSYSVLAGGDLIERGVSTETTPWLDKWFLISDKGRAVAEGQSDTGRVALGDRWLHFGSKRRTFGQASGSRSLPKSEL